MNLKNNILTEKKSQSFTYELSKVKLFVNDILFHDTTKSHKKIHITSMVRS